MSPKRAAWPLAAASVFLAVLAAVALVMVFVFAYLAIADAGESPRLSGASALTFLLFAVCGGLSVGLGLIAVEVADR